MVLSLAMAGLVVAKKSASNECIQLRGSRSDRSDNTAYGTCSRGSGHLSQFLKHWCRRFHEVLEMRDEEDGLLSNCLDCDPACW